MCPLQAQLRVKVREHFLPTTSAPCACPQLTATIAATAAPAARSVVPLAPPPPIPESSVTIGETISAATGAGGLVLPANPLSTARHPARWQDQPRNWLPRAAQVLLGYA